MWNLQTVEDEVKYLDVIAVGLPIVVAELVWWKLPVADNHERLLLCVLMYLLSGSSNSE
jgi:hypothetical protein